MRFSCFAILLVAFGMFPKVPAEIIERGDGWGTIELGMHPAGYENNLNKTWRITVRSGYRVGLKFTVFDIEDSYEEENGSCVYDYLQIDEHKRLCGNPKTHPYDAPRLETSFYSKDNVMEMRFVSDYSNDLPDLPTPVGFVAHYVEEDIDECRDLANKVNSGVEGWDEIVYCNHFCHNVRGSYYCSCRPGFTLDSNKHTCVANCEPKIMVTEDGSVTSTDYPMSYGKLSDCETSLEAHSGLRIDIRFDRQFDIEEHYEEKCVYDWLEIINDQGEKERYCGEFAPNNGTWMGLQSNPLRILFHSDLSVEKSGYKIYYKLNRVKCLGRLSAPMNGSINIPNKEFLVFRDKIRFACDRGFRMEGSNESSCMANGEWSDPPPTCRIKYCPRPDALLNISRTIPPTFNETERPFNSVINISCINKWYELTTGAAEWVCDDDEEWHPKDPPAFMNENNNYPECQPICGIKNAMKKYDFFIPPIVDARDGEWPWVAFIDRAHSPFSGGLRGDSFCGGSLVGERHVVTAAHCVILRIENLRVYLGVTDRFNDSNPNIQEFNVTNIYRHDEFRNEENRFSLLNHDIAVLRLDRPAVIGHYVRPICIPNSPLEVSLPEQNDKNGVVIGWGLTSENITARVLQVVRVPYVNRSYCQEVYNTLSQSHELHGRVQVTRNHFCAGFEDREKDSCDGDSGGPLMWRSNKKWQLNGIVSFGTTLEGCQEYVIGVYTAVANYRSFIDEKISIV